MPEIHLPTKVMQDAIKQDTQFIRGQFPIEALRLKRIQTGMVANGVVQIDVTIQPVDTNKYHTIDAWLVSTNGGYYNSTKIRGKIINSTTLRLYGNTTNSSISTEWEIVEFE